MYHKVALHPYAASHQDHHYLLRKYIGADFILTLKAPITIRVT